MSAPIGCCESVRSSASFNYRPCGRPSKVEHEGRPYCGIHNPIARKAREDKKDAERLAQRDADNARYQASKLVRQRAELCVAACVGLSDAAVVKLAKSSRGELIDFILTSKKL